VWRRVGATNSSEGTESIGLMKLTKYKKNNIRVFYLDTSAIMRDMPFDTLQLVSNMSQSASDNSPDKYPSSAALYDAIQGLADTGSYIKLSDSGTKYSTKPQIASEYVPQTRTITIGVTTQNLTQDIVFPVGNASDPRVDTLSEQSLQLSNNYAVGNMVGQSIATSGARATSANWLITQGFSVTPGVTYTMSGFPTALSTSVVRVMFYKANGNDSVGNSVIMGNNNRNPVTFTAPPNAAFVRAVLSTGTNVSVTQLTNARNNFMFNIGSYAAPFQEYGSIIRTERQERKPSVIYFSWTSGNDTTGLGYDIASPVRTRDRANQLVDPMGTIVPLEGDHYISGNSFDMARQPAGGDVPVQGTRVRYILAATYLPTFTKTGGYTNVYQSAYTPSYNSTYWIWQHDTSDVRTLIADTARCALDNGRTYRLSSTKIVNGASLTDLDTSANSGNWKWYLDDAANILYVTAPTTNFATYNIVIPYVGGFLTSTVAKPIKFQDINFMYGSVNAQRTTPTFNGCKFSFGNLEGAAKFDNTTNAVYNYCEAAGSRNDGFNAHVTGTPTYRFSNQNTFILNYCYAHDCGDDGISTHEYSNGLIQNSVFSFNDQGATVASGGHWSVSNSIFYANRGNGLVAQGSALDLGFGTQITASGCYSAYNGINYSGQGSSKTSTFINCISKYPVTTHFGAGAEYNDCWRIPMPEFATNAAAISGGLGIGEYYRITGTGGLQIVY
jgi:hypothetical protein